MKKVLKWIGLALITIVVGVFLLDSFGGYFMDGPLGPIPGGHMSDPVVDATEPLDWSGLEEEIAIEVRPEQPWSLTVWRAVVDGNLYIPSGNGAERRWTQVAIADPRVRVRSQGRIQEGCLVRIEDPATREKVRAELGKIYPVPLGDGEDDGRLWVFRVDPRATCS